MELEPRTAVMEWSLRAGRGELHGLDWIDTDLTSDTPPFSVVRDGDALCFRHLPIADDLPGSLVEAAAHAEADGAPTVLDAVQRMLGPVQWATSARGLVFTSFSQVPGLLAALVEAYGVDIELHDNDLNALTKFVVHLPKWHHRRGDVDAAVDLLEAALDQHVGVHVGATALACFTCQSAEWWQERGAPTTPLIIEGGVVRTADSSPDVRLGWVPSDRFPHELLRLLPSWATPRLVMESR